MRSRGLVRVATKEMALCAGAHRNSLGVFAALKCGSSSIWTISVAGGVPTLAAAQQADRGVVASLRFTASLWIAVRERSIWAVRCAVPSLECPAA